MFPICPRQVRGKNAAEAAKLVAIVRGTTKILQKFRSSSPRQRTARQLYPHTDTANAALTNAEHTSNKSRTAQKIRNLLIYLHIYLCTYGFKCDNKGNMNWKGQLREG